MFRINNNNKKQQQLLFVKFESLNIAGTHLKQNEIKNNLNETDEVRDDDNVDDDDDDDADAK